MDLRKIDPTTLSIEQKVVLHLANYGYITNIGDVMRAMVDQKYAEFLILGTGIPDDPDCDHEALSNAEIQEVFDNDYK